VTTTGTTYEVLTGEVRMPIAKRMVRRVVVEPSHVGLELESLDDTHTSRLDLFTVETVDLGPERANGRPQPPLDSGILVELLGRRVVSCLATADGQLELRLSESGRLRSASWALATGDGRHWSPHVGGGIGAWRPGEWPARLTRRGRRVRRTQSPVDQVRSIRLDGQKLQGLYFGDTRLTLSFEEARPQAGRAIDRLPDVEAELQGTFTLRPGAVVLDANEPDSVAPLLKLVGVATSGGTVAPDGNLEIRFADGSSLAADPGAGNQWSVSIEDDGTWFLAKDGSVKFSEPRESRPLSPTQRALLVRAYLEYSSNDRLDLSWASDRLGELVAHAPDDAYELIRELVRDAPSPYVLGIVAAGPLEDLLSDWGERYIDRLEADARDDPKLMQTCAGVWQLFMPDAVWERLRLLVEGPAGTQA
jgi:hypothetical protein